MSDGDYKYWAFISYSHQDKSWGDWLHKALETYRVPRRLIGRSSRDGHVPKRLYPIFRDREELPSSADLGNNIGNALRRSRYLIVICSPHAAPSRWVNEEIKTFKKLGREDRILALVVDGEPNASDKPDSGLAECFPPALRHKLDARGELSAERVEPIAADARADKDGRQNAKLKLLAGLLGVAYDELKQRERQRIMQRRIEWGASALLLLALALGGWHWKSERDQAQADAESGRQALLAGDPLAASVYLNAAYAHGDSSAATRLMLARALAPLTSGLRQWHTQGHMLRSAVSADGSTLTTAEANDVKRWDTTSGKLISDTPVRGEPVSYVEISGTGRYAAATRNGASFDVYDLEGKTAPLHLQAGQTITSLSFDAAEKHVLSVDAGKTLEVFELASQRKTTIRVPSELSFYAQLSDDGSRVLTEDDEDGVQMLRVWDATSGRRLAVVQNGYGAAYLEPDGKTLRTRRSGHVQFWDAGSGRLLRDLPGPNYRMLIDAPQTALYPLDDGRRYLVMDTDRKASLFDSADGSSRSLPLLNDKNIFDQEELADGQIRVLVQEAPGVLAVRDPDAELPLAVLASPLPKVRYAAFDSTGKRALLYAEDTALLWDLPDLTLSVGAKDYAWEEITPGQWSPDGQRLLYTTTDGALALYSLTAGKILWKSRDCKPVFAAPLFDHGGKHIAAGCGGGTWSLLDAADGKRLRGLGNTQYKPWRTAFDAQDQRLVIVGDDTHIWNLQNGTDFLVPASRGSSNWLAAFTPDGLGLAVFGKELRYLNLGSQAVQQTSALQRLSGEATSLSPDGRTLAIVDGLGLRRWDLVARQTGAELPLSTHNIHEAALSPDGRRLLIIDDDAARVLDAADGHLVAQLEQRAGSATLHERSRLADVDEWDPVTGFSPDGGLVLVAAGSMLGLWDARDGRLLTILGRYPGLIYSAGFAPDGTHAAASDAEDLRVWDTHLESRPPAEIAAWLACRVPQRLEGGKLVAAMPDEKVCPTESSAADRH